ncbi:hypothetical protein ACFYXD_37565 [Streptomyces platensis]|uniref:hypothetical protein n=1 Tax=Streptomyces platensis TaxID=58346 RepID=UPI0036BF9262
MQDTSSLQQQLLDKIFASPHTVVQRVGDVNQRIFNDDQDGSQPLGFPMLHAAELPVSRRFGNSIAALASDLTVHRPQHIHGAGPKGTIAVLLFDDDSVAEVVPAFERMAAAIIPREILLASPPRVLGARLTPRSTDVFPQSLACYLPDAADRLPAQSVGGLITTVRAARRQRLAGANHAALLLLWNGIREIARLGGAMSMPPLARLERSTTTTGGRTRRLLRDMLVEQLDDEGAWSAMTAQLPRLITELAQTSLKGVARLTDPLAYLPAGCPSAVDATAPDGVQQLTSVAGSIQSAKGETHAATLIVECLDRSGKKHDVHEVLGLLARKDDPSRATLTVQRAAQLLFVGATRPTQLLALATHWQRAEPHIEAIISRGWKVQDLTGSVVTPDGC